MSDAAYRISTHRRVLVLLGVLILAGTGSVTRAATPLPFDSRVATQPSAIPEDITAADIDPLLAGLTDAEARRLLAVELARRAAELERGERSAHGGFGVALVEFRTALERFTEELRGHGRTLIEGARSLPEALPIALGKLAGDGGFARELGSLAVYLLAGLFVHWIARRGLRRVRRSLEHPPPRAGFVTRISYAAARGLADLVPVVAFAVVTLGASAVFLPAEPATRGFVIAYLSGALIILAAYALSRLLLAPHAPALRLMSLGDGAALFVHRWLLTIVSVSTLVWLTAGLVILTGVPMPVHLVLVLATGAVMLVLIVAVIVSCKRAVAGVIAGPAAGGLRSQLAGRWHLVAIAYMGAVYLLWAYNMLARSPTAVWAAISSVAILVLFPVLDRAAGRFLARLFPHPSPAPAVEPPLEALQADLLHGESISERDQEHAAARERATRFRAIGRLGSRIATGALFLVVLLDLWGIELLGLAGPGARNAFWSALIEVGVILGFTWLLWQLSKALIDPRLPERPIALGEEEGSAPRTRAETLLPLLRTGVLILLVVFSTMLSLAALGVDIGPLLAGAGVIGLAIGFGAQTLVKDIVSGIFFLIDDAFRVGEYIEFGDLRGEVEGISLRSLKLRHHRGAVHTVPFGELRSVTNYHRDWVVYKMEFRLPIDTDVERVRKLVKKLGQEMMEDPEHGPKLLQPLKSQGISRLEENAIILRAKFMSKPGEQFVLRRVAFQRIQKAFAENGIKFAPRTVSVTSSAETPAGGAAALAAASDTGVAG